MIFLKFKNFSLETVDIFKGFYNWNKHNKLLQNVYFLLNYKNSLSNLIKLCYSQANVPVVSTGTLKRTCSVRSSCLPHRITAPVSN